MHFMNPVPIMKLLEIVKSIVTSEVSLEICKEFGKSLGKTVIVATHKKEIETMADRVFLIKDGNVKEV